uniref:Kelch-like protein 36 n=1 Tax=Rousettus aegyptiacus TaxID=9407 RepID=A0A7J8CHD6_ROUAE|nr:kelch like family member 36 [Rousettus aegyptiacus]
MEGSRQTRVSRPYKISESSKVYRWAEHSTTVLQRLNEQRLRGLFCDIVLVADEQRLPAHRNLLAVCSDYFNSMFTLGMREAFQKEVELIGASYIGLKAVVDFLYGGELALDGGNIDYILETAHLLQIWTVVDFCCEYLEQEVSEDNYLYLQELASIYSLKRLDAFIDGFILSHFGTLSFTPDFLQNISMQKLCVYLSSSEVQRECEHDLLQAALQWLTQQPEREAHAYQVLEHIHFPLIPKNDLLHRVKPAVWEGRIYILGGYSWENTAFSKTVQVYDLEKDKWSKGTDLPKAIAGVSACVCALKPRLEDKKKKGKAKRHQDRDQ